MHVVMTAAHAGWGSERVPVGGGGAVCERLCAAWSARGVRVTVLGTGPHAPSGVDYRRLAPPPRDLPPTCLSELAYARLCRDFERACTEWLLREQGTPVVIAHDISEGPDAMRLASRHIPLMTLVHVDVVEYFTRMYMRGWLSPVRVTRLFGALRSWPLVPDVLRLVFDKQHDAAHHSAAVVVPSPSMVDVLRACYPRVPASRFHVVPWGSPDHLPEAPEVAAARAELETAWGLQPGEKVLLTLSRISPEKGQDRLLDAVRCAEAENAVGPPMRVVICGGPAFMQGESFMRRLRRKAATLRTPVVFAGHLEGAYKRAALEMADVFVAASRHESYGLTTMEAFSAATPVVAVDSHGARATVDDTCGRRVEEGARLPVRLWHQIDVLLRDDAVRARLADGARARAAHERFSSAAETLLTQAAALATRSV